MRVLVTGAAGLLGRHVVQALAAAGHEVHAIDREPATPSVAPRIRWTVADLAEWPGLDAAIGDADAVVHLAAIPNLDHDPEDVVFRVNSSLSARVAFSVIRTGHARKLVYASSQTALGLSLAPGFVAPDYIPVDETHPSRPREGYGLSKLVGEEFCAMVSQRLAIPSVAIRLPVVWAPETFDRHVSKRSGDPVQAAKSLYAYVDARDAGEAFRLAVEAEWSGYHMIHVSADRPFSDGDIGELASERYGAIEHRQKIGPNTPLYAIGRAEQLIGYRPRYRWSLSGISEADR